MSYIIILYSPCMVLTLSPFPTFFFFLYFSFPLSKKLLIAFSSEYFFPRRVSWASLTCLGMCLWKTWYVVLWYDMIWHGMLCHDMIWDDMILIWHDMLCYDMVCCVMIWYNMWYDMICCVMIWCDMTWYVVWWYDKIWYEMVRCVIMWYCRVR